MFPRVETTKAILTRIEAFIAEKGMSERRFGMAVSNNHKLIPRLRAGFGINSATLDRIEAFMAGNDLPPLTPRRRERVAQSQAVTSCDLLKSEAARAAREAA